MVPRPRPVMPIEEARSPHELEPPIALALRRPPHDTEQPTDHRPEISADEEDLPHITAQCWTALQRANRPERLFAYGGRPHRLVVNPAGPPVLQALGYDAMRHELARVARFYRERWNRGERQTKLVAPPKPIVADLLAAPVSPLPPLDRIVSAPVFARDGRLQSEPGYQPFSHTYYAPVPGFVLPAMPVNPPRADVARATALIGELLADFPFASPADRAHAVALLLLPFVRDLIDGATPLHLVEAPTPGSGKDLLIDALLLPGTGGDVSGMTEAGNDDEWRKRLTAQLRQGPSAVVIRNLRRSLDSGALAQALTGQVWEDRLLGANDVIRLPIRCVWAASGNNPVMTSEQSRRTVRIRLDPGVERPWERTTFRHPDLRQWAAAHRGDLVWSALVLVQSWLVAGRPRGIVSLGSYENWAAVIGGVLGHVGIEGFLANRRQFYEAADLEAEPWRALVADWWARFGDREVGVAQLFSLARGIDGFDFGGGSERSEKTSFGRQLGHQRDRVFGEHRVERGKVVHKSQRWHLSTAQRGV